MVVPLNKPIVCPILIGRVSTLAALHSLVEQVKGSRREVALLCGEAGIGKSRLVVEAKKYALDHSYQIVEGHCFEAESSLPYGPFLDLFRSLLITRSSEDIAQSLKPLAHELIKILPELSSWLPDVTTTTSLDPEQEKRRLFSTLTQFFARQTTKQPMLLIIEDLHWSDDISLELLLDLIRRLASQPILFLLTYRSDDVHTNLSHFLAMLDRYRLATELSLPPLTIFEVTMMLRAIFEFSHSLDKGAVEILYTLTEGNPFFLEEVLKSLIAAGEIFYGDGTWKNKRLSDLHIPRSIQDTLHQRTERLSPPAKQVLTLAAVAGQRFDFALLQQVMQLNEQDLILLIKELITVQLVVEESAERFVFRHALTRRAIYAQLLVRERRSLHRTLAETIEQLYASSLESHLADLAYHFYEAQMWTKALEYARRAGERAQALYAPHAVIEQLTRALDAVHRLALPPVPVPELYRARGQAYETLGAFEPARYDYDQASSAARATQNHKMEWQSQIDLGFLWAGRDYAQAGTFFRQAAALARQFGDQNVYAHSLNRLANWLTNTGQAAEAFQLHEEALATFEAQQDMQGMAGTLDLLGQANGLSGNSVAAAIQYGRAIDLFRSLEDQRGLVSSLIIRCSHRSPAVTETVVTMPLTVEACEHDAAEALRLAREMQWPAGEAMVQFIAGFVFASFGQISRGLMYLQQALLLATEIEHQQWMAGAHCYLSNIYVLVLEPTLALQHAEAALSLARQLGSAWWIGNSITCQVLAYLLKGEFVHAEEVLVAAMPLEQRPGSLSERRMAWAWAQLVLAQGQSDAALQMVEQLLESARTAIGVTSAQPIPWLLKLKGEALFALKRTDEALQVLEEAKRGALERQEAPVIWQIHRALGEVYQSLRREEEAQLAFAAAREGITSLMQAIDDQHLREHFLQYALASLPKEKSSPRRTPPVVPDLSYPAGLTAREMEVLRLLAQGLTSAQIAAQLVIGLVTVNSHVRSIYSKLGVSSRSAATRYAMEHHLL